MRRRHRARLLRRLALGPLAAAFARDSASAVVGSRRAALGAGIGSVTAGAGVTGAGPTQASVGAGGALRLAPSAAWAARSARFLSTPTAA